MGKKRDQANKNIEWLIDNLVDYMEGYVGNSNCPYKYNLMGARNIKYPTTCIDCESCKEYFYTSVKNNLRERYIVK